MDAIMEKITDMVRSIYQVYACTSNLLVWFPIQSSGDVENLISRSSSQEKNVGKIVDKIMDEHYNGVSDQITFEDLMDWPMWRTFIKIYSKFN